MQPFVSIIIPCRNEEDFIAKCLDSILKNDYPKEKMEVLVVDGQSRDGTREIVEKFKIQNSEFKIRLLDNPKKITPTALNLGIKNAKGEIIIRMDAHATYEKDYISKCIKHLQNYKADNIGGAIKTIPSEDTLVARAIALSLSHPFGTGGSYFRTGVKEPREVDTVFGGCYRKEVFEKIGIFNENLERSQDIEFNLRLKKAGGKIFLVPEIVSYYYPKSSLKDFFLHSFKDGIWAIYPLKFTKIPLCPRHYIPLFFVLTLPLSIWFYLPVTCYFSIKISLKKKNLSYFFVMPIVFASRHFGYGLGSILGLIKLLI
jgi:glycosyltransferase involved in cell wall biosynthesis